MSGDTSQPERRVELIDTALVWAQEEIAEANAAHRSDSDDELAGELLDLLGLVIITLRLLPSRSIAAALDARARKLAPKGPGWWEGILLRVIVSIGAMTGEGVVRQLTDVLVRRRARPGGAARLAMAAHHLDLATRNILSAGSAQGEDHG